MRDVDTVVIGSGPGGLTAALALARAGQKVLVLEQHYLPGGWTHSFPLDGYLFSPGVHYIGDFGQGQTIRRLYEGLGIADDLVLCEMNRDGYDHICAAGRSFRVPAGFERYRAHLKRTFPHEQAGIDRFLSIARALRRDIERLGDVTSLPGALSSLPRCPTLLRWGLRSARHWVDACVTDPFLRTVLTITAGNHGVAPSKVPAVAHSGILNHYFEGGAYPMGGARSIPRAYLKALKRHGGRIRMRSRVTRILLEGRRAIGVRLEDGTEIRAGQVVSNAEPHITFGELIGWERLGRRLARKVRSTTYSTSCVSLFLAVDTDPRNFGLDSSNLWFCADGNVERMYDTAVTPADMGCAPVDAMFVTATTLKDPTKVKNGHHTMEAFTFADFRAFSDWKHTRHDARPSDYLELKQRLSERMLARLRDLCPGIEHHVVLAELGTPLTNRFYVQSATGSMYGVDKTLRQIGPFGFGVRTAFDALYMVGSCAGFHGVAGASMTGVACARAMLGLSQEEVLSARGHVLRVVPSEHPHTWPDDLRAKLPGAAATARPAVVDDVSPRA